MDGSPSLVKGHVGTKETLASRVCRSLHRTVYLKGESDGKSTFYLCLLKKSPLVIIREQV